MFWMTFMISYEPQKTFKSHFAHLHFMAHDQN